ncbi:MAG: mechanosensitive ion channel family protein [bacterium]
MTQLELSMSQLHNVMTYQLFQLQENPVTLLSILIFVGILVATLLVSRYLRYLFDSRVSDRFDQGVDYTINRLIHYTVLVIGFFVAIESIGLDLTSLAVVAGFLSVGIGFGLQNIASNFISGLILLFERPIKIGDLVTVDDQVGVVKNIKLRATVVQTLDSIDIIIPNSAFVEQNVTNWSHGENLVRVRCPVGVAYGSDTQKVEEILTEIARESDKILDDPGPSVLFPEFGDNALNFELRFWIDSPSKRAPIKSEINFEIDRRFREADIEMPYPQRDLHFRTQEEPIEVKQTT